VLEVLITMSCLYVLLAFLPCLHDTISSYDCLHDTISSYVVCFYKRISSRRQPTKGQRNKTVNPNPTPCNTLQQDFISAADNQITIRPPCGDISFEPFKTLITQCWDPHPTSRLQSSEAVLSLKVTQPQTLNPQPSSLNPQP
jgi:hypothetical protein